MYEINIHQKSIGNWLPPKKISQCHLMEKHNMAPFEFKEPGLLNVVINLFVYFQYLHVLSHLVSPSTF